MDVIGWPWVNLGGLGTRNATGQKAHEDNGWGWGDFIS